MSEITLKQSTRLFILLSDIFILSLASFLF